MIYLSSVSFGTGEYLKNCEDIFESGQILDCVSAEQWRKDVLDTKQIVKIYEAVAALFQQRISKRYII